MKRPLKIDHRFESKDDFGNYLSNQYDKGEFSGTNVVELNNISFDFSVVIPFNFAGYPFNSNLSNLLMTGEYIINNCEFLSPVKLENSKREINFDGQCWFNDSLRIQSRKTNLTFKNCEINDLDVSESIFGDENSKLGKLRVKSCDVYKTKFKNATFHGLVDFYNTTFKENVIFYKTDFLNIVVLSATRFNQNILFTYTLLNDKVIMRSTIFDKGFDFSLAVLKGELTIFDLSHSYDKYYSENGITKEFEYERAVSKSGVIPIQNKLETYRLLKLEFEKQKNIPEYLNFKLFEKKTYKQILANKEWSFNNWFDKATLWLNGISNNHGNSYFRAFLFIIIVGWFFFYLSFISTENYEFTLNISLWEFNKGLSSFVQFLIPTHKFNYLGEEINLTPCYYVFDFLGRIFVGYGIYQFIQAFRKFK
ncbi:pentapeptide repeat-containing protein [Winogradskyella sp.]|uniref:pentapeptide repeat-containing protein n=1 Tax=Winogradskyella sp. TaxID=1883156 RepID=UPI0025D8E953|nr:pentapeptide repeat-containing protein [Winogradskyella sp.]